ncbi:MAG TPA: peptidylprolyl isomerase [Pirellulales bacterium]|nr:peptidylprolyl isomerase [Pirellulales bacterium]
MARIDSRFLVACLAALALALWQPELARIWPSAGRASMAMAQQSNLVPAALDPSSQGGYGMGNYGAGNNTYAPGAGGRGMALPNNYGYGPMGPTGPTSPTRPASWPGGSQDPAQTPANGPAVASNPQARIGGVNPPGMGMGPGLPPGAPTVAQWPKKSVAEPPYDPAAILARVGTEVVQANEALPAMHTALNGFLEKNATGIAQLTPEEKAELMKKWQRDVMKHSVEDFIRIKLLLSEVRSKFPHDAVAKNEEKIRKEFNQNYINTLKENYKASSYIDLENKLRELGSSIDAQRTCYVEKYLALGWLHQQVKDEKEPTHEQMLTYYREHAADWESLARAQWEVITAEFQKFESKEAAYHALAQWGNDVLRGVPFAVVAKTHSQDLWAEDGGHRDWTTKGSLKSAQLDEAIFGLPPGTLSQIIEDEEGFHIVRVINREEQRREPFNEVQPEIKKRLYSGNQEKHMLKYVEQLREHTPVWTVFDDPSQTIVARAAAASVR